MKTCLVQLKSITCYSQSAAFQSEKGGQETSEDYEDRVWRERMHVAKNGNVVIPPMALKFALDEGAKRMNMKIKGGGRSTYTKIFETAVIVEGPVDLGIKATDVRGEYFFVNANGKRGPGTRVRRCFPMIDEWAGEATFHLLDDLITERVFRQALEVAGAYIGIGRFRPANGGFNGRFSVGDMAWQDAKGIAA